MSTKARPGRPALPEGTEAILRRGQAAAALGLSTRRFDEWVAAGKYPPPDGMIEGKRFWLLSTHNAFLGGLKTHGGSIQEGE